MVSSKNILFFLMLLPILFFISLFGWRVDFFRIMDSDGRVLFSSPASLGHKFMTRYIHSVELTPVEDEYYIVSSKLWSWEERTRSTKACMAFESPLKGRFIQTEQWLIYQGGRLSWNKLLYRVGNKSFGLNQAMFEPLGTQNFYKTFPNKKLNIEVYRTAFLYTGIQKVKELNIPSSFTAK